MITKLPIQLLDQELLKKFIFNRTETNFINFIPNCNRNTSSKQEKTSYYYVLYN